MFLLLFLPVPFPILVTVTRHPIARSSQSLLPRPIIRSAYVTILLCHLPTADFFPLRSAGPPLHSTSVPYQILSTHSRRGKSLCMALCFLASVSMAIHSRSFIDSQRARMHCIHTNLHTSSGPEWGLAAPFSLLFGVSSSPPLVGSLPPRKQTPTYAPPRHSGPCNGLSPILPVELSLDPPQHH